MFIFLLSIYNVSGVQLQHITIYYECSVIYCIFYKKTYHNFIIAKKAKNEICKRIQ